MRARTKQAWEKKDENENETTFTYQQLDERDYEITQSNETAI